MKLTQTICLLCLLLLIYSCKKDEKDDVNPFDDASLLPPPTNVDSIVLDSNGFAYLHHYIFKPTCANSGCHDGNFEPDFRSISSAYNTLVYHDVIQNDDAGTYSYRVVPGNSDMSFLYTRLTTTVPNNASGMMPLSLEPGSNWKEKRTEYLALIKNWIDNGAKDQFGNAPTQGNPEPQVVGLLAFETGTTSNPLPRVNGTGLTPIGIPMDRPIDLWFALEDDKTAPNQLSVNELKLSYSLSDFNAATLKQLTTPTAISGEGFEGNTISFTHKATVDFTGDTLGTFIYLRTYFQDGDHNEPTEIPNIGSNDVMKTRFTLQVDTIK